MRKPLMVAPRIEKSYQPRQNGATEALQELCEEYGVKYEDVQRWWRVYKIEPLDALAALMQLVQL